MKLGILAAAAAFCLAGSANAAVMTLEDVTANGPNNFTFTYQATLGPDEGLRAGDRFIIFDFAGYIGGSIMSGSPQLVASVQFTSPTAIVTPGFNDDPTLANLVFTYNGPDFRTEGGPFEPFDFNDLSARSTLGGQAVDAFFAKTTKNNPDDAPGGSNTSIFTLGAVTIPAPAVPEPATWAMMLGGFGLLGGAVRRRNRQSRVTA
jgi:hypothetical protein